MSFNSRKITERDSKSCLVLYLDFLRFFQKKQKFKRTQIHSILLNIVTKRLDDGGNKLVRGVLFNRYVLL